VDGSHHGAVDHPQCHLGEVAQNNGPPQNEGLPDLFPHRKLIFGEARFSARQSYVYFQKK
jgi:hypothetical protein